MEFQRSHPHRLSVSCTHLDSRGFKYRMYNAASPSCLTRVSVSESCSRVLNIHPLFIRWVPWFETGIQAVLRAPESPLPDHSSLAEQHTGHREDLKCSTASSPHSSGSTTGGCSVPLLFRGGGTIKVQCERGIRGYQQGPLLLEGFSPSLPRASRYRLPPGSCNDPFSALCADMYQSSPVSSVLVGYQRGRV